MGKLYKSGTLSIKFIVFLACALFTVSTVNAFNELNRAQTLIYDTAHLENTKQDQVLLYRFKAQDQGEDLVQDTVELAIQKAHENGTRDVGIDFLHDELHIAFPDFPAFKGNPVIIAMLEHIAQKMGRDTGGGALYFRNRIRDALAGDVEINPGKATLTDTELDTIVLSFKPFVGDEYIRGFPQYLNSEFSISLSETVSGGVVGITVVSADADQTYFSEELLLEQ